MERESNPMQAMCRSGCGFYGNPSTDGLCSLCYKEALKKKQQPPVSAPSPASSAVSNAQSLASLMDATNTAQPTIPPCLPAPAPAPLTAANDIPNGPVSDAIEEGAGASSDVDGCASPDTDSPNDKDDKDPKKKKNRCAICRKKVGLTGFLCRCGGLFCAVHRYSDKHNCTFDYREMGAQEIRRNNPVVVGEKIQKI